MFNMYVSVYYVYPENGMFIYYILMAVGPLAETLLLGLIEGLSATKVQVQKLLLR